MPANTLLPLALPYELVSYSRRLSPAVRWRLRAEGLGERVAVEEAVARRRGGERADVEQLGAAATAWLPEGIRLIESLVLGDPTSRIAWLVVSGRAPTRSAYTQPRPSTR